MTAARASSGLVAAAAALVATAAVRWQGAISGHLAAASTLATNTLGSNGSASPRRRIDADSLPGLIEILVANDPFRLSNAPSTVRFELASDGAQTTTGIASPTAPRPTLTLKAIVGGPPWQALIDGIPGQPPGTMAEEGQRFDRFLVKVVASDSVIVQGPDTSWVLSFRKRS
ncbi:MAG TPA: hypothetical protein VHV78_01785 [Gemmatimonadaceae bacterium]|jgi:hypothetical protein|nr:hypothetical protein [Gemmatimonadaceae bacterium]